MALGVDVPVDVSLRDDLIVDVTAVDRTVSGIINGIAVEVKCSGDGASQDISLGVLGTWITTSISGGGDRAMSPKRSTELGGET